MPWLNKHWSACYLNKNLLIVKLRARSTIAKKILVTHQCEKIWFYSHDVIDRPYVHTSLHVSQTWNIALLQVCRHRVNDHKQKLNKWGAPLLGLAKSIYYLFWPVICWSCYKETKSVKSVDGETSFTATAIVCTWFWKKQRWITTLLATLCILLITTFTYDSWGNYNTNIITWFHQQLKNVI